MSKQEIRILNYIVICISEFAKQKNITRKEAYNYLKQYKGLEFLNECYEAEHTVSLNDVVEDLTEVCKKHIIVLFRTFVNGLIDIDTLIRELTYKELTDQYSFHTEKSLKYLKGV